MKFKLVKEVSGSVPCYGFEIKTGETIELEGRLADKAKANPDFKEVKRRSGGNTSTGKKQSS